MKDCYDSLADAAKAAIASQSACNLSGVVHDMSRAATTLWNEVHRTGTGGTDWVNEHPIMKLFSAQVMHLTFRESPDIDAYSHACSECASIAGVRSQSIDF